VSVAGGGGDARGEAGTGDARGDAGDTGDARNGGIGDARTGGTGDASNASDTGDAGGICE